MTAPIVSVESLSIAYPTSGGLVHAVRDVSFAIEPGEVLGLAGESGCGKSTIAYAALGDLGEGGIRLGGRITFKGRDLFSLPEREVRRLRGYEIGIVHQNPAASLTPTKPIGKQLSEVLTVRESLGSATARKRVAEMLDSVHLPNAAELMERYPHELSGGQQQRVVIAGALLGRPDLLVLDEPTTGLDVTVEAAVLDLLQEIRRTRNLAMLYITHNFGVIARICDRVGVMYAGELVEMATASDLFRDARHPYTRGLIRSVPRVDRPIGRLSLVSIPGSVPPARRSAPAAPSPIAAPMSWRLAGSGVPASTSRRPAMRRAASAGARSPIRRRSASSRQRAPSRNQTDIVLAVEDLQVRYAVRRGLLGLRRSEVRAVDGVSLSVQKGQIVAVVGESGSGKSSLGSAILGLRKPSGGRITFLGRDITVAVERRGRQLHRMLQVVFQDHSATLNPSLSIGHIVGRPLRLFGVVGRKDVAAEVRGLLTSVGLDPAMMRRRASQLSGGQRQRVAIARAFAGRPELVVCDEITSALDVSVQASVLNFLLKLQPTRDEPPLHQPRPRRGALRRRRDRRHVSGPDCRIRNGGGCVRRAQPSVHGSAPRRRAGARSSGAAEGDFAARRHRCGRRSRGMPVPHALPAQGGRDLRDSGPALARIGLRPSHLVSPARRQPAAHARRQSGPARRPAVPRGPRLRLASRG